MPEVLGRLEKQGVGSFFELIPEAKFLQKKKTRKVLGNALVNP